jgi:hypothetical protein
VSSVSLTPIDEDRQNRARRWGLTFAAIWLFYLLSPLAAAWDRHDLRGWIGILATLLFGGVARARRSAPRCAPRRASRSCWS